MEQHRIILQDAVVEKIAHFDKSISHWSTELVLMDLKRKSLFENIDTLYQGRQEILDSVIKESGINPEQVVQVKVINDKDGKTEMAILTKPVAPAPGSMVNAPEPGKQVDTAGGVSP